MEKKVVKVNTKANEVEEFEVEVELTEDIVNLGLLINTRDCVVLYESIYLTTVKRHQRIK